MRRISGVLVLLAGFLIGVPASAGATAVAAAAPPTAGGFVPLTAVRILDTKTGNGAPKASIAAGATLTVKVAGRGGVPLSGVGAVWLTVSVAAPTAGGQLLVYPADGFATSGPNVTFPSGRSASNAVLTSLGTGGAVSFRNTSSAPIAVAADVGGYVLSGAPATAGGIGIAAPNVLLDNAQLRRQAATTVKVTGRAGIPTSGVAAVIVDISALGPDSSGGVIAYPAGDVRPDLAQLAYAPGRGSTNLAVVRVNASSGEITLYNSGSSTVQISVGAVGWVRSGNPTAVGAFFKVAPAVLLDTSTGTGITKAPIGSGATVAVAVLGRANIPATNVSAVVLNLNATSTGSGHLTAFPTGSPTPATASSAFTPGRTSANLVTVPVGTGGRISFFNGATGSLTLRADVVGYIVGTATLPPAGFTWNAPQVADTDGGLMVGVSCTSATFCAAVDLHTAVTYDGTSWSTPVVLAQDSDSGGSPDFAYSEDISSLDCVSATNCRSGFYHQNGDGIYGGAYALNYNGTGWSGGYLSDQPTPLPALVSISCVSASSCAALYGNSTAVGYYRYNGTTWVPTQTSPTDPTLTSLSCVSTTFCMAVGVAGQARVLSAGGFGSPAAVDSAALTGVSCVSTSFCVAVDSAGKALRYNGTSWTAPVAVATAGLTAVSCASTTFCVAVDSAGGAVLWNGTTWSASTAVDSRKLTSVSCPTAQFCVAVDDAGNAVVGRAT